MIKKFVLSICLILSLFALTAFSSSVDEKKPLTVAESSDYASTSRYTDVMDFIEKLQKQS